MSDHVVAAHVVAQEGGAFALRAQQLGAVHLELRPLVQQHAQQLRPQGEVQQRVVVLHVYGGVEVAEPLPHAEPVGAVLPDRPPGVGQEGVEGQGGQVARGTAQTPAAESAVQHVASLQYLLPVLRGPTDHRFAGLEHVEVLQRRGSAEDLEHGLLYPARPDQPHAGLRLLRQVECQPQLGRADPVGGLRLHPARNGHRLWRQVVAGGRTTGEAIAEAVLPAVALEALPPQGEHQVPLAQR